MVRIESVGTDSVQLGGLMTYSTSETDTGLKWTDGSTIYRKVIDFGSCPDTDVKFVDHNITGLDTVVSLRGLARAGSNRLTLPYPKNDNDAAYFTIYANSTQVAVVTGTDRTSFDAYIIIEYTKS